MRILSPKQKVGQNTRTKLPPKKPNFSLVLIAVRSNSLPQRYAFDAANVSCTAGASAVMITIGRSTRTLPCQARQVLASARLTAHRTYTITARAVRYDRRRRILARGPVYRLSLYLPGDEAWWAPSGL